MTGSSISGPITKARLIKGRDGKADVAIANEIGEFRARVVQLKQADSS